MFTPLCDCDRFGMCTHLPGTVELMMQSHDVLNCSFKLSFEVDAFLLFLMKPRLQEVGYRRRIDGMVSDWGTDW